MKKTLLKTMLLLCALIVGSESAWGQTQTATITFASQATGTNDSSTAYTTSNFVSSGISSSDAAYGIITCSATSKCYSGKTGYGLKAGASSNAGSFTIAFSTPLTNVSKITLNRASYSSSKTATITVKNGSTTLADAVSTPSGNADFADMDITDLSIASLSGLTVQTSKYCYIRSITIEYSTGGGSTAAATTTTIDDSGITNTDVYTNTAAGSLSASVTLTSGGTAVPGATVTWSGDNDDVATINANTGAVTLVAAGNVTFTASYAGVSGTYQSSSDTYEMTVISSAPYVQPTEIEITPNYTFWGKTSQFSGSTYSELSGSQDNVSLAWTRGSGSTYANTTAMRFYKDNELTFTAPTGYEIKSIVLTMTTAQTDFTFSPAGYDTESKTWTGSSEEVTMSRPSNASSYAQITKFTITIGLPSTDPSISADDVDITYDATGGSIAYTLENATGNVSATVTSGNWLTLGTITSSAVPFTCTANTGVERTATVTLSFSGAENKVVTVTQAAAPVIYTTIPNLFAAAESTSKNVNVTFGNWVVSGVSGSNAFVTDNSGNGFIIYTSNHGFAVNDKLSGTVMETPLKKYNGSAEFTNLTSSTNGLTVSNDGEITVITNKTIADLGGVNTGAVITLSNLTYDGTNLSDGTNSIKPYNTLYSSMSFESGHKYNVTGVYQQYGNSTKEILPRSSADIVEVSTPAIAANPTSLTGFTYEVDNGPSTTKTISVTGSHLTADITLSLGNNSDFEMSTTEGSGYTNSLTLTQSAGTVAATTVYVRLKAGLAIGNSYSGTITLTSTDATDATVTLSGSVTEPVVDYATLPFSYDGNGTGELPNGLTVSGTGTYSSSPKIKLDSTGDYVVLKLDETPGTLSFDVKANPSQNSWTGILTMQTAGSDGNFTDFTSYSDLFDSGSEVITKTISNLPSTVRYIKWIYTKTTGNAALGRIVVEKPSVTLNAYGYATYTSNSAIDYSSSSTDGFTAWAITGIEDTDITFTQIQSAVPAGTGVLLKGTAGATITPIATTSGTALETNLLEGFTIATEVQANTYYGLKGETFVKVNKGTVKAGKALLLASAVSEAKAFRFVFEEATGITHVEEAPVMNGKTYDLSGREVKNPTHGLYIVNGKKVYFK